MEIVIYNENRKLRKSVWLISLFYYSINYNLQIPLFSWDDKDKALESAYIFLSLYAHDYSPTERLTVIVEEVETF